MAAISNTPYNPSDNSAPFMVLPEHVYGFVDLKTLTDIHRYLGESEMEDDVMLAKWVQENYLYEPTDQSGRTIRTAEGFSQLDRAYRRVRSLTNKAQDKWPFFDRNWKQMSSITVRNNARGEAAPGVTYGSLPVIDTEASASSITGESDKTKPSPIPLLQVPFGTKQTVRQIVQKKDISYQAAEMPTPPATGKLEQPENRPESEKESTSSPSPKKPHPGRGRKKAIPANSKSSDEVPKPSKEISPESQQLVIPMLELAKENEPGGIGNIPETAFSEPASAAAVQDQSNLSVEPDLESAQDASLNKVRGSDGRYLPKTKPSPVSKRSRRKSGTSRIKSGIQSKSLQSDEALKLDWREREAALAHASDKFSTPVEEKVSTDVQSVPNSTEQDNLYNGVHGDTSPEPQIAGPVQMTDENSEDLREALAVDLMTGIQSDTIGSQGSATSPILAAEAEAIASNLDRRPPALIQRPIKRKSEPIVEQEPRKRGRRGGLVGRPRKSDHKDVNLSRDAENSPDVNTQSPVPDELHMASEQVAPRMTTRRMKSRSAVPTIDQLSLNEPVVTSTPSEKPPEEVAHENAEVKSISAMEAIIGDETTGHNGRKKRLPVNKTSRSRVPKTAVPPETNPQPPIYNPAPASELQMSDVELLSIGLSKTSAPSKRVKSKPLILQLSSKVKKPTPNSINPKSTARTAKGRAKKSATTELAPEQLTRNPDAGPTLPNHAPGQVEYFARIHTFTGPQDIPIAAEKLDAAENESIRKYAEWMATEGEAYIPYQQFRSIFGFAKKG